VQCSGASARKLLYRLFPCGIITQVEAARAASWVSGSPESRPSGKEALPRMTYIIVEPCVGVKDGACIDVCPVDCIYTTEADDQMFINPDECIDCAACEPVCPVAAIFAEDQVPEDQQKYIALNYDYFQGKDLDELREAKRGAPRQINE
jgi:NAD-dependent dihydropyrimidine dehydrogenase PreA subunit